MTIRVLIVTALLSATAVLGLDLIQKTGTNAPTSLLPGQFGYDLTNQTLYIGGAVSNPVLVGRVGIASTNDINAAVASRLVTNAANLGFRTGSNGTNLLWIIGTVTNQVNLTPLP
jgi:hypothetical protein